MIIGGKYIHLKFVWKMNKKSWPDVYNLLYTMQHNINIVGDNIQKQIDDFFRCYQSSKLVTICLLKSFYVTMKWNLYTFKNTNLIKKTFWKVFFEQLSSKLYLPVNGSIVADIRFLDGQVKYTIYIYCLRYIKLIKMSYLYRNV